MRKLIYEKNFTLTTGSLDNYDNFRPYAILDLFQEVAGEHAYLLGLGYQAMIEKNYAWVITKNKYQIYKYPTSNEIVKVITWPSVAGRADFDRNYKIVNQNNEVIVRGISKWCIIDVTTRKICRSGNIDYNGEFYEEETLEFDRINNLPKEELTFLYNHVVRSSQLDHYQHLNNAKYSDIILDALDLNENQEIFEIQINNQREVRKGETIEVYSKKTDEGYLLYGFLGNGNVSFSSIVKIKNK